jgi:uncharacterized protein
MRIRSISCFYNPATPHAAQVLKRLAELVSTATRRFRDAGFEVQSARLATVPFPLVLKTLTEEAAVEFAVEMQAKALSHGFVFVSLGPALASVPESYELVRPMLAAAGSVFLGAEIANGEQGVLLNGAKACGKIMAETSRITPDGFANLHFAGLANVAPYAPFFPAAFAHDAPPAFALAIEAADLVLGIFQSARSLASAHKRLLQTLEAQAKALSAIAEEMETLFEVEFKGIDMALAPYPQAWCSLGSALERLGPVKLGLSGSLAAAAFLADILDQGNWPRTGFNGLLLPVLEDSVLAGRAGEGTLTIKDLLLYSAVCGTGLDTLPLPGDATPEQLAAVLVDVAALSSRLHRPLIARLMPIPGKKAGDEIHFNFEYFADGRIMDLPAQPLQGLLDSSETILLR